ncbi:TRNA 2-methylthioadenosine synthase [Spironucleus salmonicida]|uniref:Threonylcarbamoyladenosine tRNA methylthiotransferase n=1 Tax=Spironucleus salmonicida TaxID=348837 RepID=V6M254_9EUKA|nr:TRNA 2-methylthioadenosine synthase [Spironucleus salmonicida]|eukprot:EST47294.1 tRNA 2-methylthioadenosine synthase [Spironucleus salmonicida]
MDLEDAIYVQTTPSSQLLKNYTFFVITMGCAHNQSDSDQIASFLTSQGAKITSYDAANLIYINSCAVKTPSEEKAIFQATRALDAGKKVVLGGCVSQALKQIGRLDKYVADGQCFLSGVIDDKTNQKLIQQLTGQDVQSIIPKLSEIESKISALPSIRFKENIDIIPICTGCLGNCTYCQTFHARGKLKSHPKAEVLQRIQQGLDSDTITEIWLTGEDTLAWGLDIGSDFAEILAAILALFEQRNSTKMLRIGMTDPESVIDKAEKLAAVLNHRNVYKFLHLPVQSGSNDVLREMRRRYTVEQYVSLYTSLKALVPALAIATDFICAFPSETEEQHQESVRLMDQLNFDIVNVTQYYPRANTPAATMTQIQQLVKKQRTGELARLAVKDFNREQFVGQVHRVQVLEELQKVFLGRRFAGKLANQITVLIEGGDGQVLQFCVGEEVVLLIVDVTRVAVVGRFVRREKGVVERLQAEEVKV